MLPLSRHDSSVPLRTMCVFCAPFASRMQLRGIPVSVPGLARHAVPLTPSIAASLSWPSCAAEHAFSAKIPHAGRTNPLPVARYCFKSFSRNAYGSPRKCCKQKTYDPTKPFRCNTYRSEEHTSELQSRRDLVCRLLLEKKKKTINRDQIQNQKKKKNTNKKTTKKKYK